MWRVSQRCRFQRPCKHIVPCSWEEETAQWWGWGDDKGPCSSLCSVWTTLAQTTHKISNEASVPIYTNVIKANMKFSFNFSGSKECVLSVELNFISIDRTFQTFQTLLITTLHHDELGVAAIFLNSLLESISERFSRLHQE